MSELEIENYFVHIVKNRPPIFYIDMLGILIGLSSLFYGVTITIHVIMSSFLDMITILAIVLIFCHLELKNKKESTLSFVLIVISLFTAHLIKIYVIQYGIGPRLIRLFLTTVTSGIILKFRERLINKLASYEYIFDTITKILLFCSVVMIVMIKYSYRNDKE